jgi:putrescine transport system substrate-binding protein
MPLKLGTFLITLLLSCLSLSNTLKILNWNEYVDPDVISQFEAENDVTIEYIEFNNTDEFSDQFFDSNNQFDVIFPASDIVGILKENKLIKSLDRSKFTNYKNINQVVMDGLKFEDKDNEYTVPYMWGTTGIGYNIKSLKKAGINTNQISWSLIFDNTQRKKAASCGIGVVNERDEVFSAALSYLGYSINTKDKAQLKEAGALIKVAYEDIKYLHTNQYTDDLRENNICVGIGYSGDILAEIEENEDINYVIPSQGAAMWIDVMAIPTNSTSPDLAYRFIDFLMSAKAAAKNSDYAAYPTPMLDAQPYLDPDILADTTIYPDQRTLAKLHLIAPTDKKVRRLKHRLWTKAICVKGRWCSVPMRSIF